jgi:SPP1 gp7 family putative phage head morphogenesis protein
MEAALNGKRASEVAAQIAQTGEDTESRATLIARTEIAKSNANITQARANYVGATHYVWRTAEDSDVRETHAELDGKVFAFSDPPDIPGEGQHGPGEFPNCRCYAEPIIPGDEPSE